MSSSVLQFNLHELLALLGLAQCLFALVYMASRIENMAKSVLPILFFLVLALAFLLNLARRYWEPLVPYYTDLVWLFWTTCVPISALLVLQIARITKVPAYSYWNILLLVPMAYAISLSMDSFFGEFETWLHVTGVVVGGISLLTIWTHRAWLDNIYNHKNGKERFWLIISLVVLNIGMLSISLFFINGSITLADADFIRTMLGISFTYIASTSLFRLYPQALMLSHTKEKRQNESLSDLEIDYAMKIENLLHLEKVYQEPNYGRSDLARELEITESLLSKIVNIYFEKSVPQLLNEHRVEDAKMLLKQTDADTGTIADESGFNSMATFNRVFKDIAGVTPSDYRASVK